MTLAMNIYVVYVAMNINEWTSTVKAEYKSRWVPIRLVVLWY